ncbi:hypothetical protein D1007_30178 [Hordeum vulgare]|nr:hypothetical protein D1007_30178 [Hordeum vulgare]
MMRNNRIFQSLGIGAIASMIRKTNDVQEGRTNEVQEGSGVINDDPEYNPKEDEVVVHKSVKALKESRTKRSGVKKTANQKRKSLEASAAMPPGRVMSPPRRQTKRILEPDEPDRVTRQKATMAAAKDHQESPVGMDFESLVEMRDEFPPMDEETTLFMDESGTVCLRLRRGAPSIDRNDVETYVSNKINREKVVYQQRTGSRHYTTHIFATKEERKGEELSAIDLFKATHNSKKHVFSEPVKIVVLEMEKMKDTPVPEGEEPKSDAEIVEEVLKTEVKQSTFLRNVGLKSSSNNCGKGTAVVAAHVRDLQQKLERSELQAEVMQEEMAAIKLKAEEYEATRDKELELLCKKSQEQEEKLAHLMALFGAKAS